MGEIHGINDAEKLETCRDDKRQEITVSDHDGKVILRLSACGYPAGLDLAQARFIARCLTQAADRIERAAKVPG